MRGYVRIDVCPVPGCQQGYAIRMHMEVSDVRCKAGTAASVCTGPNTTDGPDYSGELQSNGIIRITDHLNGANGDEAGTVVDVPFPVTIPCANTSDQTQGGFCSFDSSTGGSLMPIPDHSPPWRAVVELAQLVIYDGGADGYVGSQPNTLFAIQGFFIP
jgi:hypothetical protein